MVLQCASAKADSNSGSTWSRRGVDVESTWTACNRVLTYRNLALHRAARCSCAAEQAMPRRNSGSNGGAAREAGRPPAHSGPASVCPAQKGNAMSQATTYDGPAAGGVKGAAHRASAEPQIISGRCD